MPQLLGSGHCHGFNPSLSVLQQCPRPRQALVQQCPGPVQALVQQCPRPWGAHVTAVCCTLPIDGTSLAPEDSEVVTGNSSQANPVACSSPDAMAAAEWGHQVSPPHGTPLYLDSLREGQRSPLPQEFSHRSSLSQEFSLSVFSLSLRGVLSLRSVPS